MKETLIHKSWKPEQIAMSCDAAELFSKMKTFKKEDISTFGISMDESAYKTILATAMDAGPETITAPSVGTFVQFLQYWMPETIEIFLAKRNADEIMGRDIVGSFETEEVVFKTMERTGQPRPYTDVSDVPVTGYNVNAEKRTNVRFELGMESRKLEDVRMALMRVNPDKEKRAAIATGFEVNRNNIAFWGYNSYDQTSNPNGGRTYGMFNDPNLLPYLTETGAKPFEQCTFEEMKARLTLWMATMQTQTAQNINVLKDKMVLALSPNAQLAMISTLNQLGNLSVMQWFNDTYKGTEVIPANEMIGVDGGDDVAYLIARSLNGAAVVRQMVTSEMRLIGIEPHIKGMREGYSHSTAGFLCQQPLGVVRATNV